MFRNKAPIGLLLFLIICVVFYVLGCGEYESPLSSETLSKNESGQIPSTAGLNILERPADGGYDLSGGGDGDLTEELYTEKRIDSQGGSLKLEYVKVTIPAGAVNGQITASITIPDPSIFLWEMGPDNYTFNSDVTIKIELDSAELDGIDPEDIQFYTYNEEDGEWELVGGAYNSNQNHIWVCTNHFSYWALASD